MPPTQSSAARRISFEVVTPFALLATLLLAAIAFVPLASIPFISTKAFILIIIGSLLALRFLSLENTVRIVLVALTLVALILLALFNAELELIVVGLVSFGLFVESVMRRAPSTGDADLEDVAVLVEDDVGVGEGAS